MSKATKATTAKATKATAKAAKAAPAAKAVKVAKPRLTEEKVALAAIFTKVAPAGTRNVFQAKFKPLNLDAHNPQSASERDDAALKALRQHYGSKPFTHKQCGLDTGAMARLINLDLLKANGKSSDGEAQYRVA